MSRRIERNSRTLRSAQRLSWLALQGRLTGRAMRAAFFDRVPAFLNRMTRDPMRAAA